MSRHQGSSSRGFTLIEVLVAAAILGVGLIPAFLQASSDIRNPGQVTFTILANAYFLK